MQEPDQLLGLESRGVEHVGEAERRNPDRTEIPRSLHKDEDGQAFGASGRRGCTQEQDQSLLGREQIESRERRGGRRGRKCGGSRGGGDDGAQRRGYAARVR